MNTIKQFVRILSNNDIGIEKFKFNISHLIHYTLLDSVFKEKEYNEEQKEFIRRNINKFIDAILNADTYLFVKNNPDFFVYNNSIYNNFMYGDDDDIKGYFELKIPILLIDKNKTYLDDCIYRNCTFLDKKDFTEEIRYLKEYYNIKLSEKEATKILSLSSILLYKLLTKLIRASLDIYGGFNFYDASSDSFYLMKDKIEFYSSEISSENLKLYPVCANIDIIPAITRTDTDLCLSTCIYTSYIYTDTLEKINFDDILYDLVRSNSKTMVNDVINRVENKLII